MTYRERLVASGHIVPRVVLALDALGRARAQEHLSEYAYNMLVLGDYAAQELIWSQDPRVMP